MAKKEKRAWQAREMRMISEFLAREYKDYPYMTRVRLGAIHPELAPGVLSESEKRMVGVWRRWADAIVVLPDRLVLIEGAIRPHPGDISILELYERLIPSTPELEKYKTYPIEKVLLYAMEDPLLILLAREKGIRCILFQPDWLSDYLAILYPRERRPPLTEL